MNQSRKKKSNYRYDVICEYCGKFISQDKIHSCGYELRKIKNKFRCNSCKEYKLKKDFPKDRTHKYGIYHCCKKCRSARGWGRPNAKRKMMNEKQLKERMYSLEKELRIIKEILETNNPDGIGRPKGSLVYTPEQVKFLKENKEMHMKNLIPFYNRTF